VVVVVRGVVKTVTVGCGVTTTGATELATVILREGVEVIVMMVTVDVTGVTGTVVTVTGGIVTPVMTVGVVVGEIVVPCVVVVKPRVPEIVMAARETDVPSATTLFHNLKRVGEGEGGVGEGGWKRRLPADVSTGNNILPVLVTSTRLENCVVVVVRVDAEEVLTSADDTTTATVGNEVVRRASVIVVTGNASVNAGAEKTETLDPDEPS
jgi:hypothetical protein